MATFLNSRHREPLLPLCLFTRVAPVPAKLGMAIWRLAGQIPFRSGNSERTSCYNYPWENCGYIVTMCSILDFSSMDLIINWARQYVDGITARRGYT